MAHITVTLTDREGRMRRIENAETGRSLMETARANEVAGIIAECGGACSCATCHVYIDPAWFPATGKPDEVEDDMLDMVDAVRGPTSRLSCQITLEPGLDGLSAEVAPEL